jgi:hypothetical protein
MALMDGEFVTVDNMLNDVDDEHVADVLEVAWIAQGMMIADANEDWMHFVLDDMLSERFNTGSRPVEMTDGRIH